MHLPFGAGFATIKYSEKGLGQNINNLKYSRKKQEEAMKLTEKKLRELKKVYDKTGADISLKMAEKLIQKSLIGGWPGHYFVTEEGQKQVIKRFGTY